MTEIKDYIALFDLDGVILDSEGDYTKFWDEMGKKYLGVSDFGITIKGQTLVKILGDNYRREDHEEITTQLMDYESKMPFEYIPGARRFLDALSRSGVRMAVVSNKPHRETTRVVQTLFPRDTFSMVLGMMEKFEKKPALEPLEFVLNYLGVEKEDAVYVGDSDVDVAFARNTGIDCISCTWGYRSRNCLIESGASRLIDDFEERLGLLL